MSVQNDNTLVTKGDLKELYTDKIAPYLGGGISYYYSDRSGQELKSGQYALAESVAIGTGTNITVAIGAAIPFVKQSGDFVDGPTTGSFIVPAGMRIEVTLFGTVTDGANNNSGVYLYNETDGVYLDSANSKQMPGAYFYGGQASLYGMSQSCVVQWTNNTGKDIAVSMRNAANGTVLSLRVHATGMTVKEIGRIVDPVKYVSNNSDLEETPVGNIISYMGNSIPKHHLACDGTEYAIGTYPELEAHIIKEFGSINYFGGDGTTTWAVPDLNGEFLRGTGTNSHTNQGSGANVGVHQDSTEFPAYYTGIGNDNKYYIGYRVPNNATSSEYNIINKADKNISKTSAAIYGNSKEDIHGTASTSNVFSTIKPTNTSVKFCIKYESTYHVIVPSHMYKVSVPFSVKPASSAQIAILDTTNIKGDSSLISGGNFVAPIAGWYICSGKSRQYNWTSGGDGRIVCYWRINGEDTSGGTYADASTYTLNNIQSINLCSTIYLNKGDTINLYVYGDNGWVNTTFEGNLDFCLLTANYKDNIIAGGEVYSEEEQLIGTWTDGKPLYQKTIEIPANKIPNNNSTVIPNVFSNVETIVDFSGMLRTISTINDYTWTPLPRIQPNSYDKNIGVDIDTKANAIYLKGTGFDYTSVFDLGYMTIQYTKTTDQANTYQYKNSLLLTRPDMWEPNTEIDFGGGLYGQRFTGNMPTIAAGKAVARIFQYTISSSASIVSYGGHITGKNASGTRVVITPNSVRRAQRDGVSLAMGWTAVLILDNILLMNAGSYSDDYFTTSDTYDVWVTYKK